MDINGFTYTDLRRCAERETKIRAQHYPGKVKRKRYTQEFAGLEIAMMETIARYFRALEEKHASTKTTADQRPRVSRLHPQSTV